MIAWPAGCLAQHATKAEASVIPSIDKYIDHPLRIVFVYAVLKLLGKQSD